MYLFPFPNVKKEKFLPILYNELILKKYQEQNTLR